jgi:hypothetical protein
MCVIWGLQMCLLLANVLALLVSWRHPPMGSSFITFECSTPPQKNVGVKLRCPWGLPLAPKPSMRKSPWFYPIWSLALGPHKHYAHECLSAAWPGRGQQSSFGEGWQPSLRRLWEVEQIIRPSPEGMGLPPLATPNFINKIFFMIDRPIA